MYTDPQLKQPIQIFHSRIVAQLTANLKRYHKPKPPPTSTTLSIPSSESQLQYYTSQQISMFLYDVLELQNASIQFIMKDIFESDKKNIWHLEQILRTVLDVQFVITVNNSLLALNQQLNNKQKQLSFIKINPMNLVQIIYDNCFFLQNSQNAIPKQIIQLIVAQINQENGNKGHIFLFQYKTFMVNNILERHSLRKLSTYSPNKSKTLTPIGRYNDNSESIKEVDEESEMGDRSRKDISQKSIKDTDNEAKHGLFREINDKEKDKDKETKQVSKWDGFGLGMNDDNKSSGYNFAKKGEYSNIQSNMSSLYLVYRQVWRGLSMELLHHIQRESFNKALKVLISSKLTNWPERYRSKLFDKITKLTEQISTNEEKISIIIRLMGEYGFKIHHDSLTTSNCHSTIYQIPYFLNQTSIYSIFLNSYGQIIPGNQTQSTLKKLTHYILDSKGQYILNSIGHQPPNSNDHHKHLSFKDLLTFFNQLSQPSSY